MLTSPSWYPLSILVSLAMDPRLIKAACELSEAGAADIMIDSGAFTNRFVEVSAAKRGEVETQVTMEDYLAWWNGFPSTLYGVVSLDRLRDAEGSERNLQTILDAGHRPMPVVTVDASLSICERYMAINPRICCGSAGSAQTDQQKMRRYRAVADACGPEAELHALGFTKLPDVMRAPVASCDSSSFTAGKRYGFLTGFDRSRIVQCTPGEADGPRIAKLATPARIEWSRVKDPEYQRGLCGALGVSGAMAYAKAARACWHRARQRLFFAVASLPDFCVAMTAWTILTGTQTVTVEQFREINRSLYGSQGWDKAWLNDAKRRAQ